MRAILKTDTLPPRTVIVSTHPTCDATSQSTLSAEAKARLHPTPQLDSSSETEYAISVRALCEFTAKEGDLDLRFTPAPSGQEGIAGHGAVTSRRPANYQREVSLTGEYKHLLIRGRADGFDPVQNQVEEIKTFRGDLGAMPDNHRQLHWGQVKIYG